MSAKIVPMPPRAPITDEDLEIVETACRDNAARCLRKGAIEEAEHWQRVADDIAHADTVTVTERRRQTLADLIAAA